jgi:hypothetical protein
MQSLGDEGMTKKELIEAFEGLDDDAQILVKTSDNDDYCYNIYMTGDKVSRPDVQNEITLYCK